MLNLCKQPTLVGSIVDEEMEDKGFDNLLELMQLLSVKARIQTQAF